MALLLLTPSYVPHVSYACELSNVSISFLTRDTRIYTDLDKNSVAKFVFNKKFR